MEERPSEVRLRILTSEDAGWLVDTDRSSASAMARSQGWQAGKLAAELDEGLWASDERIGWAVVVDGDNAGYALVRGLAEGHGDMEIRILPRYRGRGVGREVLRQLADHHFAEHDQLIRLVGRTHESNIPMQRAFNAAGFRMEARYRDSYEQSDGRYASEWGYALTRADWEAGRHRTDEQQYDLHGLTFETEQVIDGDGEPRRPNSVVRFRFLQEGRRALARYRGGPLYEGELAGVLVDDVLRYTFVHEDERGDDSRTVTGSGRSRMQRREDGRLEVVNDWSDDDGRHGRTVLVEVHEVDRPASTPPVA